MGTRSSGWKTHMAEHLAAVLRPVSGKEVRDAFFSIPDIKSPGPDGYTSKFFKDAWGEIGGDVIGALQDFFLQRRLLTQINATTLTLIPKCDRPQNVTQFRPIACCNVVYKDLIRLHERPNASARCLLKIDLEKANDTLEWQFVEQLLRMLKFPPEFQSLVMQCITTASFSLSLNGRNVWLFYWQERAQTSKGDTKSMMLLLQSFSTFAKASGLRISAAKSNAYFRGVPDQIKHDILRVSEYKRVPLVTSDKICKPKEEGGLGIKDQGTWNKAMVGRVWNHLKGRDWMKYSPSANSSWVWRRICKVKQEIAHGFVDGVWVVQPSGYTPAGCYEWLRDARPPVYWSKVIWNNWAVPKHQFMGWLVAHEALNTVDKLANYEMAVDDRCLLCGQSEECISHLFFACQYSRRVILAMQQSTGCQLPLVTDLVWWSSRGVNTTRIPVSGDFNWLLKTVAKTKLATEIGRPNPVTGISRQIKFGRLMSVA
ncbi:uncharacterized protein LOC141619010 [Silene latifolia]|uniref:uncharacterized protein LOC141619010 n=1 Tax=Silene latifolia TaxID=37657 RepID=UPI003D7725F8